MHLARLRPNHLSKRIQRERGNPHLLFDHRFACYIAFLNTCSVHSIAYKQALVRESGVKSENFDILGSDAQPHLRDTDGSQAAH